MSSPQNFSRAKLADFSACKRRYQLRYDRRLAWPTGPLSVDFANALARGRQFHQLMQRHFLGLPVTQMLEGAPELSRWWRQFETHGPPLPAGRRLPEFELTVPIGQHFLTGRFDLLIVGRQGLHLFDWKTEARPRSERALHDDLQTRVYLALAAEGATAIQSAVRLEEITLTYWYVGDPPTIIALTYDPEWHAENWAFLEGLVGQIGRQMEAAGDWPLTDDLEQCRHCAYQVYCGRQVGSLDLSEWQNDQSSPQLEPDRP